MVPFDLFGLISHELAKRLDELGAVPAVNLERPGQRPYLLPKMNEAVGNTSRPLPVAGSQVLDNAPEPDGFGQVEQGGLRVEFEQRVYPPHRVLPRPFGLIA